MVAPHLRCPVITIVLGGLVIPNALKDPVVPVVDAPGGVAIRLALPLRMRSSSSHAGNADPADAGPPTQLQSPPACIRGAELRRNTRRTVDAGQPRVPAVQRQQGIRFAHTTDDRQLGNRTVWLPLPSFPLPRMVKPHLFSPAPGPGMPMTAIVAGEVRSGAGLTTRTAAHEAEVAAARPRRTPLAARGIDAAEVE